MYVVYIIEETPKIFTLLKNIMSVIGKEKYLFVQGEVAFSSDMEKYFSDNEVIIFHLVALVNSKLYKNDYFAHINLAFVGDIDRKIDMNDLSSIDSLMLNAENLNKIDNTENIKQVITCGLREKDTVTFSSAGDDYIILNVQRMIKNIQDRTIEPFEKKIYLRDVQKKELPDATHGDVITALAILLFCDVL